MWYSNPQVVNNVLIKASHIKTLQQVMWKMYNVFFFRDFCTAGKNTSNALWIGVGSATNRLFFKQLRYQGAVKILRLDMEFCI